MTIRIMGLGGSRGTPSASQRALELALEGAATAGAEVELFDLGRFDLPHYDPTAREVAPAARHLARLAARADGMIWSSPTYHGALSGALKNALDWLQLLADEDPPYLTDKPIGLIATAAGGRGMQTINTMASSVQALRGWAVPFCVTVGGAYRAFADDGSANDPALAAQLTMLGRSVVDYAGKLAGSVRAGGPDDPGDPGDPDDPGEPLATASIARTARPITAIRPTQPIAPRANRSDDSTTQQL